MSVKQNPFDRKRAIGSKWTARSPQGREKHHEVVALGRDRVELRCVLTGRVVAVPIETLRDAEHWRPGWT